MLQRKVNKEEYVVRHEEFTWETNDKKELYAQCWDAGKLNKAVIVLVHGLGEHSTRYEGWAERFVKAGISVVGFDLRGHGQTPVKISATSKYPKLLDDIDVVLKNIIKLFPNTPIFLYGHSFGGNLVANYAITRQLNIAGIVLTSPWFEIENLPPRIKLSAAKILSRFAPRLTSRTGLKAEEMSRELKQVHQYRNDPHMHSRINVRLFMSAYEQGLVAKRSIYKINLPLLLLHGSSDNITSCKASREFAMNAGEKTTFHEIEGGYHELHNDSENETVFQLINEWMNNQLFK